MAKKDMTVNINVTNARFLKKEVDIADVTINLEHPYSKVNLKI